MPLLYIDLIEGRTPAEVKALLDAIHDAVVDAFGVPPRDRYQVVHTHPAHEIVAWDTGLGIDRSSPTGGGARGEPATHPRNEGKVL